MDAELRSIKNLASGEGARKKQGNHVETEYEELELKLGPPGESHLDTNNNILRAKRPFQDTYDKVKLLGGENTWPSCKLGANDSQSQARKAYYPAMSNSDHKRVERSAVIGWPPVGTFRKNIANSSSLIKPTNTVTEEIGSCENVGDGNFFVKVNMDGIPIGRKVDIKAYSSYETLSSVICQLFQGLWAAQSNISTALNENQTSSEHGNGEYTLVYEDDEGDRMLVGDVPWQMFASSVRRLRLLKKSQLPNLPVNTDSVKTGASRYHCRTLA